MGTSVDSFCAVDAILRFNKSRKESLLKVKFARMAENVFAFFRGTDHLFAGRWPQLRPSDLGPSILVCGDLHLENLGAYETDDGDFRYDINDFDEALVAPCSVDLVRLTASILLAGEVWEIPAAHASGIALDCLNSYRTAIVDAARTHRLGEITPRKGDGPIWDLLGETALGEQATLLDQHTRRDKDGQRRIIRSPDKHPDVRRKRAMLVRKAVEKHGATTSTPEAFRVLDVTRRIMGIGSLGVRRYTVLVAGGGKPQSNRLLDVKEAAPSSVLGCSDSPQPDNGGNDARRMVRAQRQLQSKPTAGLTAIDIDGRHYRLREMVPDENRSKLDRLQKKPEKLRDAVAVVGQLTAWSQMRGCGRRHVDARHVLASWADSGALDAVLASAVRCVDTTCRDFESFREAYDGPPFDKYRHD
jgi:uncharacterized protein (DUF2252 family)